MLAELGVEIGGLLVIGGFLWLSIRNLKIYITESLETLSEELAQAVMSVAQSAASANIEQPNPMQMMLMQLVQQRMTTIDQPRSPTGQFEAIPPRSDK
jgi:hypothetical protein